MRPTSATEGNDGRSRALLFAAATGAAIAVPFLNVEIVPWTDLGQHIAQIRLAGEALGDPDTPYRIQWLTPYALVYAPLSLLWWLLPPMLAARCAALLVALVWVLALHRLAHRLGQRPEVAVLASVLVFHHALYWGFVNFVFGFGVFVLWLEWVLLAGPSPRRRIAGLVLGLLLYSAHALWLAAALLALGMETVVDLLARRFSRRRLGDALGDALCHLPAFGLAVWSFLRLQSSAMASPAQSESDLWSRLAPWRWPDAVFGGLRSPVESVTLALLAGWLALAGLRAWRERDAIETVLLRVAALLITLFFVLPDKLTNTILLNERFLPCGVALLLVALPVPRISRPRRVVFAATTLALLLLTTTAAWRAVEATELDGLAAALEQLPSEPRVVGLDYLRESRFIEVPVFLQMPAYAQVAHGGRLNFTFAYLPTSLVVWKEPRRPPWTWGLEWFPQWLEPRDFDYFDYLLVAADDSIHQQLERQPRLAAVTVEGTWRLYRIATAVGIGL